MQITNRFTIAVHIMAAIDYFGNDYDGNSTKTTSEFLAGSVGVNAVTIRTVMQDLRRAGLVRTQRGSGGAAIARPLGEISLYDIYEAVDPVKNGKLFKFHEQPNPNCPVGRNIHHSLDGKLDAIQEAMEDKMREITLADVVGDIRRSVDEQLKAS